MAQPKAPNRRGRRVPLLADTRSESTAVATYVCTMKPLPFGEFTLTEGVEVPGAASWTRIDAWVSARRIRKLEHDEAFTPFMEFAGATCESLLPEDQRNAERLLAPPE